MNGKIDARMNARAEAPALRQVAAYLADQDRGRVDGAPLDGLKRAGEPARLAVLDHQRVHQHVGEGQPEPHHGEQSRQPPVRVRDAHAQGEARRGGQRGGEEQVTLPAQPEEGNEVGEEPVDGLDEPGDGADGEEGRHLTRRESALLQHDGERLVGQVPHALREVDDGEEDGETLGVGRLEGVERPAAAQAFPHYTMNGMNRARGASPPGCASRHWPVAGGRRAPTIPTRCPSTDSGVRPTRSSASGTSRSTADAATACASSPGAPCSWDRCSAACSRSPTSTSG